MTITLSDFSTALRTYLDDSVTVEVTKVTSNLEPDEEGTFTINVTNAAAPTGVRLVDLCFHVSSSDPKVALLLAPGGITLIARETSNPNSAVIAHGTAVETMGVFPILDSVEPDSTLDAGETTRLEIGYRAVGAGTASITCHVHASVEQDDLFPTGQRGRDGEHDVKVLR